jgi:hypothetical protein
MLSGASRSEYPHWTAAAAEAASAAVEEPRLSVADAVRAPIGKPAAAVVYQVGRIAIIGVPALRRGPRRPHGHWQLRRKTSPQEERYARYVVSPASEEEWGVVAQT